MHAILFAIRDTPQRVKNSLLDPIRRRNVLSRIAESYVPSLGVLLLVTGKYQAIMLAGAIVTLEWLLYEWLLEPLGFSGHYFERGPRDGETFLIP